MLLAPTLFCALHFCEQDHCHVTVDWDWDHVLGLSAALSKPHAGIEHVLGLCVALSKPHAGIALGARVRVRLSSIPIDRR